MNKRKGLDKLLISVLAVLISLALGAVLIVVAVKILHKSNISVKK